VVIVLVWLAFVEPLPVGAGELPRFGSVEMPGVLVTLLFPSDPVLVAFVVVVPVVGLVEDEFTVVVVLPLASLVSVMVVLIIFPVLVSTVLEVLVVVVVPDGFVVTVTVVPPVLVLWLMGVAVPGFKGSTPFA